MHGSYKYNQTHMNLIGGHTIGTAACGFITNRIFNSTGNTADPTMDQTFVPQLQRLCPQNGDGSARLDLDTGSGNTFDTSYFINLSRNRGILQSDHVLWTNPTTRPIVQEFMTSRSNFNVQFARSMVKMSNIGVKTGRNGEIRRVCSAVN